MLKKLLIIYFKNIDIFDILVFLLIYNLCLKSSSIKSKYLFQSFSFMPLYKVYLNKRGRIWQKSKAEDLELCKCIISLTMDEGLHGWAQILTQDIKLNKIYNVAGLRSICR